MIKMRTVECILAAFFCVALFSAPQASAYSYYDSGYSYHSYLRAQQPVPTISIDLDPQHQIDSAFRETAREDRLTDMLSLLNQGANIDSVSDRGRTALMFASRNCSVAIGRKLLRLNADVNVKDGKRDTALIYATEESCLPIVKLLLRRPELELGVRDKQGKSVFDYARESASLDVDGAAERILNLLQRRRIMHSSKAAAKVQ